MFLSFHKKQEVPQVLTFCVLLFPPYRGMPKSEEELWQRLCFRDKTPALYAEGLRFQSFAFRKKMFRLVQERERKKTYCVNPRSRQDLARLTSSLSRQGKKYPKNIAEVNSLTISYIIWMITEYLFCKAGIFVSFLAASCQYLLIFSSSCKDAGGL